MHPYKCMEMIYLPGYCKPPRLETIIYVDMTLIGILFVQSAHGT